MASLQSTHEAEAKLGRWSNAGAKPVDAPPRDYFVPHFGADADIVNTQNHLSAAEQQLGHVWKEATFKQQAQPPRDYFVPNFGQDKDIRETLSSASQMEQQYGH